MNIKSSSFLLWLLASLWGPSFLFIKVAVAEIPPFSLVAFRVGAAAAILYLVLRMQGRRLPGSPTLWRHFTVLGILAHALPFTLFSWGELHIDSALASVLNGTTPLFTLVVAHFFVSDDRLSVAKVIGSVLGFQGLIILISPSFLVGLEATTWGILAVTLASLSYGVAMVYARRNVRGLQPLVAPTAQLGMAAVFMVPLAIVFEEPFAAGVPSLQAAGSLLGLTVFGTAAAFIVYYRILEKASATYLSLVTYIVPVFGILLGVFVLNETLAWNVYVGCALIISGVMIVNGTLRLPQKLRLVALRKGDTL